MKLTKYTGPKWLYVILFCLLHFNGYSQFSNDSKVYYFNRDSLPNYLTDVWKYSLHDTIANAARDCKDSAWYTAKTSINIEEKNAINFKGLAWFRFSFKIDSNLLAQPMAVCFKQLGASEVYFDGKLIKKYGVIMDSLHSVYFNPQELPLVFTVKDTGIHVLAVRFANFNASDNYRNFNFETAGFNATIGTYEQLIEHFENRVIYSSLVLLLLIGLFVVLSLLHLLLFLFYRTDRSNLYFSLFTFFIACMIIVGYTDIMTNQPKVFLIGRFTFNISLTLACYSLSLFVNELFIKKRGVMFWIISSAVILFFVLKLCLINISSLISLLLLVLVSFEATIIIIKSIYKKIKGARIIGFGILFFSLFFITIFVMLILSRGDFDINDSTIEGIVVLIFAALAIISVPISMSVYLAWNFANINRNLSQQLEQVKQLSELNLQQEQEKVKLISNQNEILELKVEERTAELKKEKKKSDDLLLNILPEEIAEELKQKGKSDAHLFEQVSVLFTDFVGFTTISEKLSPNELVAEINIYFTKFDEIIGRHGLEKIKTIGDAYMAVCGIPAMNNDHAINTVKAAMEIIEFVKSRNQDGAKFSIRIGVNSGSVVAGIVGVKKFAYDIWGDTVNTAARMEQNSEPGKINVTGVTYELIKTQFNCSYRGKINAKNKGEIDMYFVESSIV